ncbi:hypothetical protein [Mammaliicoccus fleurettii]|uniref:hypothetical protein n=1 Tax=Mammaliicoccus fleurettii TaxID=150056 RepID=UPI001AADE5CB|nr:hypothetical protein [Mammaliicoccus fleurettii]MBO3062723.1 hypothetical protein [Mammaliicoccus fleurettii]
MAKFKVLKQAYGKKEEKQFEPGEEVELTVKRVQEIETNIYKQKKFKGTGPYFERIEEPSE